MRSIENAEKNPKEIENWVKRIDNLNRSKPAPTVQYSRRQLVLGIRMPSLCFCFYFYTIYVIYIVVLLCVYYSILLRIIYIKYSYIVFFHIIYNIIYESGWNGQDAGHRAVDAGVAWRVRGVPAEQPDARLGGLGVGWPRKLPSYISTIRVTCIIYNMMISDII